MISYEKASNYIQAAYIYVGVTDAEIAECAQHKYVTEVEGVKILGVELEVPELMMKRVVPAPTA